MNQHHFLRLNIYLILEVILIFKQVEDINKIFGNKLDKQYY